MGRGKGYSTKTALVELHFIESTFKLIPQHELKLILPLNYNERNLKEKKFKIIVNAGAHQLMNLSNINTTVCILKLMEG